MTQEIPISRRAIFISENKRIMMNIRGTLGKNQVEIETGYLNLHSLPMIKRIIAKTGNTTFMRTELLRFIREQGFPYTVFLDFNINLGLDEEKDPDGRKLLRTFLISYIILSRGSGFEKLKGSFMLIGNTEQMEEIKKIEKDPMSILDILHTRDKIVNTFIEDLRNDKDKFHKLFFIKGINSDAPSGEIVSEVNSYLKSVDDRMRNISVGEKSSEPKKEKAEEANQE